MTSTEIVLDRARGRSAGSRLFPTKPDANGPTRRLRIAFRNAPSADLDSPPRDNLHRETEAERD